MDADLFDVDANEEPDAPNDPIYNVNLKNYIYDFFKALASDASNLQALGSYISAADQEVIKEILNTKK